MKKLLFALMFLAAVVLVAPTAYAEKKENPNRPDRKKKAERRDRDGVDRKKAQDGLNEPFLTQPSPEMLEELKRHRTEVRKIGKELRDLSIEIRTAIKAAIAKAREEAKPNEEQDPDVEEPDAAKPDIKAIIAEVRAKFEGKLEAIATKLIDEAINHTQKKLEIMKATREKRIKALKERILNPKYRRGNRGDREGRNGREGRDGRNGKNRGDRPNRGDGDKPQRGERPNRGNRPQ